MFDSCPFCKKKINKSIPPIINYEIISMINFNKRKFENSCTKHENETLNFYCTDCQLLICQQCLLLTHIGHKINRPEDSELSKSLKTINEFINLEEKMRDKRILNRFESNCILQEIDNQFNELIQSIGEIKTYIKYEYFIHIESFKQIIKRLDCVSSKLKTEYELIKKGNKIKIDNEIITEFDILKENYDNVVSKLSDLSTNSSFNDLLSLVDQLKNIKSGITEKYSNSEFSELKNSKMSDIENLVEYLIENQISVIKYKITSSNDHIKLVDYAAMRTETDNYFILNILKSIDRGEFVTNISSNTYVDTPLMIGWNTTISAPHMHLLTLSFLYNVIKEHNEFNNRNTNLRGLDIGSGSGYMSVAISKLLGPNSTVYALDHIEEIINFARNNIAKNHSKYVESGRIKFIVKDGRDGYQEGGKYHIIHVGAAVSEVPNELLDQLQIGGYMWIPVGQKNSFKKILLITKTENGDIVKKELMSVSYAEMTTREDQLSHIEENDEESVDEL